MKKSAHIKPVDELAPADFQLSRVWQFTTSEEGDETMVRPLARVPTRSLSDKVVGTQVRLANGSLVWASLGNVDATDSRLNEHFVSLSVYRNDRAFTLARYFDVDYERRGPRALAEFLELPVDDVFPIFYDIRDSAVGEPGALMGAIQKEPRERLTRAQIIALAVPKKVDR